MWRRGICRDRAAAARGAGPRQRSRSSSSPGPEAVSVTVYRDPQRSPATAIEAGLARRLRPDHRDAARSTCRPGRVDDPLRRRRRRNPAGERDHLGPADGVGEKNHDAGCSRPARPGRRLRSAGGSISGGPTGRPGGSPRPRRSIRSGAGRRRPARRRRASRRCAAPACPRPWSIATRRAALSAKPTLSVTTSSRAPGGDAQSRSPIWPASSTGRPIMSRASSPDGRSDGPVRLAHPGQRRRRQLRPMPTPRPSPAANRVDRTMTMTRAQRRGRRAINLRCWPAGTRRSDILHDRCGGTRRRRAITHGLRRIVVTGSRWPMRDA